MRWLGLFIMRPVATTLLCLAFVLAGLLAYRQLPVSPLPQVDFPMISVSASMPGASPETMASSVAMPLEQSLGGIAGLEEMSSRSTEGSTRVQLVFEMGRDINGAARDVQAAINAARPMLPSSLRGTPTYQKVNPSSAPIMTLALTSEVATQSMLYDLADTVLAQKLAQVPGVGEVQVGGSSLPAVRVNLNPHALTSAGVALDDVRQALASANTLKPNGLVENANYQWQLSAGSQLMRAEQYRPLIVAWRDGAPIRLQDVATVEDSVEERYTMGFYNRKAAVLLTVRRQPDANIIATVDAIRTQLESFRALLPEHVDLSVAQDRTPSIRATLLEAESTLVIAVLLVVGVVLCFLRNWRAAVVACAVVPASLITTFGVMWWLGYSLNTLSLMALIIATGFVVDDAIVVLENIMRHMERGMPARRAAWRGVREVGFTVLAMSLSLVAVFIPIMFLGDMIGRLFREFAMTLSAAILVSLMWSLTLTPMMCAYVLKPRGQARPPSALEKRLLSWGGAIQRGYAVSLDWALRHGRLMMLALLLTIGCNVYLYSVVPKGLVPQQDTGQLIGFFRVDEGASFQNMLPKLEYFREILLRDPAVSSVAGFIGGRSGSSSTFMMIQLKPFDQRDVTAQEVVNRLRGRLQAEPGARLTLIPSQDLMTGPMRGSSAYDYTLMSSDILLLKQWLPRVRQALAALPELTDVESDEEFGAQQVMMSVDRDEAARLGVDMALIASTLNSAFGQREVSIMYGPLNQYRVIMAVEPRFARDVAALKQMYVVTAQGARVPLSAFTRFEPSEAPASVRHEGLFAAENTSFSLAPGVTLDQAMQAIDEAVARISLPTDRIQAGFLGDARSMQKALAQQPWLILGALVAMYIVLGMLYESFVHPITILSTLPSAGIGAVLALMMFKYEFTFIALIGVFLLIGIVKKNAIMMVDFALQAERERGLSSAQAIRQACLVRLRPILMTTLSAIFGALPLVLATGAGVELRRPLGIAIVGGLLLSQVLTLYTTPVLYLYLDRWRKRWLARHAQQDGPVKPAEGEA
ncbi:efflux RND transporter permease subunit [Pusillimonas sp. CC-YST705]|uniref:Efflux RND transporter permease subunit n=1 Tax=Mesopusillimonas faecipullorum TaxID=2755040 RepID=A0ABS8C9H7_9BURK|nr:efflux RND transporter permease subunit [Mesopusillimonas faecipullorum]MCB5362686.1 efflux RND transporter permease subunit [Mesopusillimonas faecipullorum]